MSTRPTDTAKPFDTLITGSSGHLGHALHIALPSLGYTPLGIDILPPPSPSLNHTCIQGNITDPALLTSLLSSHPSIQHIIHSATLHKPHVGSHCKAEFVEINITGTLTLLEAVARAEGECPGRIKSFVFISTTSAFGSALSTLPSKSLTPSILESLSASTEKFSPPSAVWIDEAIPPIPKNIYGTTKCAAEDLCHLFHLQHALPTLVLRTSRFFPEADDDEDRRNAMSDENLKVCELAYRRVDVEDVVGAVVCAMEKAKEVGWGKYVISAPPPFVSSLVEETYEERAAGETPAASAGQNQDTQYSVHKVEARSHLLQQLAKDAPTAIFAAVPLAQSVFERLGWRFLPQLDRVYHSSKAVQELGWRPRWTFERVVERLARGESWKSDLTDRIGKKGYHGVPTGVYTTVARGAGTDGVAGI